MILTLFFIGMGVLVVCVVIMTILGIVDYWRNR